MRKFTLLSELKRRRVFRVAVVYAGVAFIVFQVADFAFPALHVPDWFSSAVVVLLILGFLIAVGLAWAFDITEKGVVRTPSKEEAAVAKRAPHIVIGNKTLAVVAVLAIGVAVWSWWGRSRDPLAAFEHSVVVMPFTNLTADPNNDVWEKGVASLLIDELTLSEDLYVLDSQTLFEILNTIRETQQAQVIPQLAREVADRLYVQGMEDFTMQRYRPAIEALRQAVALDSLLGPAYNFLFDAYYLAGIMDSAKAIFNRLYPRKRQFSRDIEQQWDFWRAKLAKDVREEIHIQEQSLTRNPLHRWNWAILGWTYVSYNKPDKAIAPLEKALELSDRWGGWKWVYLYRNLGYAYHETGRHRKELKVYKRALELLPEHPRILYPVVVCYLSRGDTARAAPYLERYQQSGEEAGWSAAIMANNLGLLCLESGLLDRAQAYYRRAMEMDPEYWSAYSNLGALLIDNDLDIEEGLLLLDKALEQTPDNYTRLRWKGWGLYKQGRYEEALALLERSWELRPWYNHDHYQHLQAARKAAGRGK